MAYLALAASTVFQAPILQHTSLTARLWMAYLCPSTALVLHTSFHSQTMKGIPSPPMTPFFGDHLSPEVDMGKCSVLADGNHCLLATNTHRPFFSMGKDLEVFTK
jgi:hypothetical protein